MFTLRRLLSFIRPYIILFAFILISILVGIYAYNSRPNELAQFGVSAVSPNRLLWRQTDHEGRIIFFRPDPLYDRQSTLSKFSVSIESKPCSVDACALDVILETEMSRYFRLTGDESTHLQQIKEAGNVLPVRQEETVAIKPPDGCTALAKTFYLGGILPSRLMVVALDCGGQRFIVSGMSEGRFRQVNDSTVEEFVRSIKMTR